MSEKSFIKILLATAICCSAAHAQIIRGVGIKTGLMLANQAYQYETSILEKDTKYRKGFDFGIFAEINQNHFLSVLTEVHYTQKGVVDEQIITGENNPVPIGTLVWDKCIHYLSFPVLLKLNVKTGIFTAYFIAGPRLDLRLSYTSNLDLHDPVYDALEKVTVGYDVGIGFETEVFKSSALMLEFRFSPDVTDAHKSEILHIRNRAITFLLGFSL